MQTIVCLEPGKMAHREAPKPTLTPGNALVRIRRIGVCGTDLHAFEGTQPFFEYPRILGHELSGELVDADGADDFAPGEPVTILPYFNCGTCIACRAGKTNCCVKLLVSGVHMDGGMVEYLMVPSYSLVHNEGLNYDQLALVEPLSIGAHGVRRAGVQPGEVVLVVGAGPIGLGTMAFAKLAGATVIALDINADRLAYCRSQLGISHTLNAHSENITEQLAAFTNGDMPTVVMDATGSLRAINTAFSYVASGGRFVLVGLQRGDISVNHPEFHRRELTLMSSRNATRTDFNHVIASLKNGLIDPNTFITHRIEFGQVSNVSFTDWLNPENKVIKAMVTVD